MSEQDFFLLVDPRPYGLFLKLDLFLLPEHIRDLIEGVAVDQPPYKHLPVNVM